MDRATSTEPKPRRFGLDLAVLLLSTVVGCTPASSAENACTPFSNVVLRERGLADLTDAVPFRTYVALTDVEPFAHHYVVSGEGVGRLAMIAAVYAANGSLQLVGGGDLGQILRPPPPEARDTTLALERELARRCPNVRFHLHYAGAFRRLRVTTFALADVREGSERIGRLSQSESLADAALENMVASGYHHSNITVFSSFGLVRVPKDVRWVELKAQHNDFFTSDILAAARSVDAGAPGPRLADLPLEEPDALLMNGHEQRVHLVVTFSSDSPSSSGRARAVLPISVHDAVFGPKATSQTVVTLGSTRYEVAATLVPNHRFAPTPERRQRSYRGNLSVRILAPNAGAFERSYLASGEVVLKDEEAAVLYELTIPGGRTPSWDEKLLHGKLRSTTGATAKFKLDTQIKEDPPH